MTSRVARSIILSVGIAVFLTAVYCWLLNETHFKPGKTKQEGYNGQLSFHTGSSSGALLSEQAVRQARTILEGRLKRMSRDYALKAAPDNRFQLPVDKMQDQQGGSRSAEISPPIVHKSIYGGHSVMLFGPRASLEYSQMIAILLTSTNLTRPVQVLHTNFTPIHSGPSPPVIMS